MLYSEIEEINLFSLFERFLIYLATRQQRQKILHQMKRSLR